MGVRPFELPAALTRIWFDSAVHMLGTTTEFWTGLMGATPSRAPTSTASPWWMPPQADATARAPAWPAAFSAAGVWAPAWPGAMPLAGFAANGANPLFPWLSETSPALARNPFMQWGRMWLEAAMPAAPWAAPSPGLPVAETAWQPIATAYRTANGHAMAAVLRTMADMVEPKPATFNPAHYWPHTLGTRH